MKTFLLFWLPVACLSAEAQPKDWLQMFNGKDLSGWSPKISGYAFGENFANTFRVQDGYLSVGYEGYDSFLDQNKAGKFGHIFYQRPFSYYVIAVEYRFVGDQAKDGPGWATRNSGIMIHGQDPKTMGKDQDFPISIEVQLLGGLGKGKRPTANLCTPGTNVEREGKLFTPHCLNSTAKTYDGDQWVRVEVVVHGGETVDHRVEGESVLNYERPQIGGGNVSHFDPTAKPDGKILEGGWISLQSESHPVQFRKVEILNLEGCMDKKAKNYRDYFVKADEKACRY